MSHSNSSDLKADSKGSSNNLKRKSPSQEVVASFGSFAEFGQSNIGSTAINGNGKRLFSTETATAIGDESFSRCPVPRPTSCCLSLSPRQEKEESKISKTVLKDFMNSEPTFRFGTNSIQDSDLPGKKRSSVSNRFSTPSAVQPSTELNLGEFYTRPFGSIANVSRGSLFGLDRPGSSSSQSPPMFSSPQNSIFGQAVKSGTEFSSSNSVFRAYNFGVTSTASNKSNQTLPVAYGQTSTQSCPLFNQSNPINITVPSFGSGQQSFVGQPFLLCLNDGPGFGFGQTFPCILAFPQSTSTSSTQTSASTPTEPKGFTGSKGT